MKVNDSATLKLDQKRSNKPCQTKIKNKTFGNSTWIQIDYNKR